MSAAPHRREQTLPRELLEQVERVLRSRANAGSKSSGSLLDTNAVDTLNALFPDETALSKVETVTARLKHDHAEMQREIEELRLQLKTEQDVNRMQTIQSLIGELLAQMTRIREKATESEAIVRELTKDIQALDLAKRNLTLSLTTLKRFQMLVNNLGQLEFLIKGRKYDEIAPTLSTAKQLAASFKPFTSVERIGLAWKRMQALNGTLRSCLDEDYDAFFLQDRSKPVKASLISNACIVVDVMGEDVRLQLIDRYCSIELKEYRRVFRATDEAGQLDNISRRFAWFKRLLAAHDEERERIFPSDWKVGQHLCARFTEITRDDLAAALTRLGPKLTVTLLLESLQHTLDFESMMSRKFGSPFINVVTVASTIARPPSTLSSVFDSHMGVFVDAQDKALADMLAAYRGPRPRNSLDDAPVDSNHPTVLPSSTDLFYFYRQNLEQCAKLSNKGPLFDLCALHKKWLRIYAEDVLVANLKRNEKERKSSERKSMEGKTNVAELKNACLILNTAEYCQTTALQLEERIKDKISDEYTERITLQPERDIFVSVIASAIALLLRELELACDMSFASLGRSAWNDASNVSGPSNSVTDLVRAVSSVVDVLRDQVEHKKWLRNFYDKAASILITRFTQSLVKSRPIKEVSAEQILIDLQALRACLLELPGPQMGEAYSSSFTRNITKTTSNLETLLKVIIAPVVPADAFVQNYTVLIGDSSFSNFQKILDLKGTPRTEQNVLLDTFLSVTSTKDDLESTSFLSLLDMDPDSNKNAPPPAIRTLTSPSLGGSRVTLPSLLVGAGVAVEDGVGLGVMSAAGGAERRAEPRREVFSDLKRFMNFGRAVS